MISLKDLLLKIKEKFNEDKIKQAEVNMKVNPECISEYKNNLKENFQHFLDTQGFKIDFDNIFKKGTQEKNEKAKQMYLEAMNYQAGNFLINNLTAEEAVIIVEYTSHCSKFNNVGRLGKANDFWDMYVDGYEKKAQILSNALKKYKSDYKLTFYRGIKIGDLVYMMPSVKELKNISNFKKQDQIQILNNLKGKFIRDKGFMSTTIFKNITPACGDAVLLVIDIPPRSATYAPIINFTEQPMDKEVLLDINQKLRVDKAVLNGEQIEIYVTAIKYFDDENEI